MTPIAVTTDGREWRSDETLLDPSDPLDFSLPRLTPSAAPVENA